MSFSSICLQFKRIRKTSFCLRMPDWMAIGNESEKSVPYIERNEYAKL